MSSWADTKAEITQALQRHAQLHVKRVLTQLDRDPHSPTRGCFDRNHWHYKIRDFASSILQQGVFTLEAVRKGHLRAGLSPGQATQDTLAAINALARQTDFVGAVDEYYPYERSYPAAAFGLYAVSKVLSDWTVHSPALLNQVDWQGLNRLANHLSHRVEMEAQNQYAAGLAGLAIYQSLPGAKLPAGVVNEHATRLFSGQHIEGWFHEYGGPDFGYLTVTVDALVDYYDATGDERAVVAIDRAVSFLAEMVGPDGELPWTLNSRNTDYITPYGLVRTAARSPLAAWLVTAVFRNVDQPSHFLWSIDDRYYLHYVYASVVRSLDYLEEMVLPVVPQYPEKTWLPGAGYLIVRRKEPTLHTLYVAARKGGIIRIHHEDGSLADLDHGWRIPQGKTIWTSNWWGEWAISYSGEKLSIEGRLQACRFHTASPAKHMVLRALSWVLRNRLVPILKRIMIFRPGEARGIHYRREIELTGTGAVVNDQFVGGAGLRAEPSPRQNLRHVASAGTFHPEEGQPSCVGTAPTTLSEDSAFHGVYTPSTEHRHR